MCRGWSRRLRRRLADRGLVGRAWYQGSGILPLMPIRGTLSGRRRNAALPALFLLSMLPAQAPGLPSVSVEGRVVDAQHRPIGAALVRAELDGVEIARCAADAMGQFTFAALPQAFVVLLATAPTPDIGAVEVDLLGESRVFAEVVLLPARKVSGTLRDDAGKAIEGAWITAAPSDLPLFTPAACMARSDANGYYELTHVLMGPARMRFWAPGHDGQGAAIDGHEDVTQDATLPQGEERVLEVALESDSPELLAAARLMVSSRSGAALPPPLLHPEQDRPGHWTVCGWCFPGELAVHLACKGAVVTPSVTQLASGTRQQTIAFRVDAEAPSLQGTFTAAGKPDAAGLHFAGVGLLAQPLEGPANNWNRIYTTVVASGAFTMQSPVAAGEWFAMRTLSNRVVFDANAQNPTWFLGQFLDREDWSIPTKTAHSVHVVLQRADGKPAPGCRVSVSMRPRARERQPADSYPILIGQGVSNTDGTCDIQCLSVPAEVDLLLEVVGAEGGKSVRAAAGAEARTDFGVCELDPPAILFGQVRHHDGRPAIAYRVRLGRDLAGESEVRLIVTDREGRFRVSDLPLGVWYVKTVPGNSSMQRTLFPGRECELLLKIQ